MSWDCPYRIIDGKCARQKEACRPLNKGCILSGKAAFIGQEDMNIRMAAVIQCAIALERCSGFNCSRAFYRRENYFKDYPGDVMYVPFSCGGCPGRRISRLLSNLEEGARRSEGINKKSIAVHFTACVVTDNGHYPSCPFKDYMKAIAMQKGFKVIEGGYESRSSKKRRENNCYRAYRSMDAGGAAGTEAAI